MRNIKVLFVALLLGLWGNALAAEPEVAYVLEDEQGIILFLDQPCALPGLMESINPRFREYFYTMVGKPKMALVQPFMSCYAVLPDGDLVMLTPTGVLPPVAVDGVLLKRGPGSVKRLPDPSKTEV